MNFGIHRDSIYVIRILISIFFFRFKRNDHSKTVNNIYGQNLDIIKFLYDLYKKKNNVKNTRHSKLKYSLGNTVHL